jgi:CheY-like chemotaxis protein
MPVGGRRRDLMTTTHSPPARSDNPPESGVRRIDWGRLHARRTNQRVLVAEDDAFLLGWVADTLRSAGYEVVECADGSELLERIGSSMLSSWHKHRGRIDAIVTDVRMPGFTGIQILDGLQRASMATPIVLMTAYDDGLIERRARTHGAAALLLKPFDADDLLTALLRVTQGSRLYAPPVRARRVA